MAKKLYISGPGNVQVYDDELSYGGQTPFMYMPGSGKLGFVDAEPAYITDSDSGFLTAGFVPNEIFYVIGSSSNNGLYQVALVEADKLTLNSIHTLSNETGGALTALIVPAVAAFIGSDIISTEGAGNMITDSDGDTSVEVERGGDDDTIRFKASGADIADINSSGIAMSAGARISEFSTDDTLSGNSDVAVPTEKAVKGYTDDGVEFLRRYSLLVNV